MRKPNESPAFISATTGLGGQTRQLFRQVKTVQELRKSRNAQIALGNVGRAASLDGKVAALAEVLRADPSGKAFTVRLDDAAGVSCLSHFSPRLRLSLSSRRLCINTGSGRTASYTTDSALVRIEHRQSSLLTAHHVDSGARAPQRHCHDERDGLSRRFGDSAQDESGQMDT